MGKSQRTKDDKPAKKRKPLTATPVGRITAMLRKIWMWSPERAAAMRKAPRKICEECGCEGVETKIQEEKTGKPRLEIHHAEPCDMTELAKLIHRRMFPGADKLDRLCQRCHIEVESILKQDT